LKVENQIEEVGIERGVRVSAAFFGGLLFELKARIAVDRQLAETLSASSVGTGEAHDDERHHRLPSHGDFPPRAVASRQQWRSAFVVYDQRDREAIEERFRFGIDCCCLTRSLTQGWAFSSFSNTPARREND
jgi:hypothetical protein